MSAGIFIGTAGWVVPSKDAEHFPTEGSHLERYSQRFNAAEINSSFHRPHRASTYERWAASVPADFRFSAKLPKAVTHTCRMVGAEEHLTRFADEIAPLGEKLAVLLVQLPPSFAFDAAVASAFFDSLRRHFTAAVACEPRHASWFTSEADACLASHQVARVAADPVLATGGERPGGWTGLQYYRLHGSPRVYRSSYETPVLERLAAALTAPEGALQRWCMFDNTASSAAAGDALRLQAML